MAMLNNQMVLLGGLEDVFYFFHLKHVLLILLSIIYGIIFPIDELICFKMVKLLKAPTRLPWC